VRTRPAAVAIRAGRGVAVLSLHDRVALRHPMSAGTPITPLNAHAASRAPARPCRTRANARTCRTPGERPNMPHFERTAYVALRVSLVPSQGGDSCRNGSGAGVGRVGYLSARLEVLSFMPGSRCRLRSRYRSPDNWRRVAVTPRPEARGPRPEARGPRLECRGRVRR